MIIPYCAYGNKFSFISFDMKCLYDYAEPRPTNSSSFKPLPKVR